MHSLRHRTARAADAEKVLDVLQRPGDGYGPSSTQGLAPLLARLLEQRAVRAPLFEDQAVGRSPVIKAVGVTAFATLEQGREWLATPPPQIVDHILAREAAGDAVLLRPDRIGRLNATEGLTLVFLAFRLVPESEAEASTLAVAMFDGFRMFHSGYYCPIAIHPTGQSARGEESIDRLGFRPVGDGRSIRVLEAARLQEAPFNPFLVLVQRLTPSLGFTPAEQDMLQNALLGLTDAENARELDVSVETIRKRWRSVFARVGDRAELGVLPPGNDEAKRGPEKRGALLRYLDAHLEELRPHDARG